uniref:uncharacterized protein LOC120344412 n=1 Tax=Styela clava TaxID=7725 RepID=UPI0019395684|nr:uncharacterized protein LOC120344412 [Styela clava]
MNEMRMSENKLLFADKCDSKSPQISHRIFGHKWTLFTTVLFFFVVQFTTVYCVDEVTSKSELEHLKSCSTQLSDPVTSQVEVGWPYTINCDELFEASSDYFIYEASVEILNETDFQCIISSGDTIVHKSNVSNVESDVTSFFFARSESYSISAVSENQNGTIFTAFLANGDSCFSILYTLIVTGAQPDKTCNEVTFNDDEILHRSFEVGNLYLLPCFDGKKKFHFENEKYELKWYKGCEEIRVESQISSDDFESNDVLGQMKIADADFSSAGNYTCSVVYNGRERFVSRSNVCVKYGQQRGPPNIRQITSTTTKASIGNDVQLTCGGWGGTDHFQLSFAVIWYKNVTNRTSNDNICVNYVFYPGNSDPTGKHECNLLSNAKEATKCYTNYKDAEEDKREGLILYNSTLTIKNFQDSDVGQYVCKVLSTYPPAEVLFNVKKDQFNVLLIVIPVIVGFLLIVIICLLIFACVRSGYIKGHWKKKLDKPVNDVTCKDKEIPKDVI